MKPANVPKAMTFASLAAKDLVVAKNAPAFTERGASTLNTERLTARSDEKSNACVVLNAAKIWPTLKLNANGHKINRPVTGPIVTVLGNDSLEPTSGTRRPARPVVHCP